MLGSNHPGDDDPEQIAVVRRAQHAHVVRMVRDLAAFIERAPTERVANGLAWMTASAEALRRTVERVLGPLR